MYQTIERLMTETERQRLHPTATYDFRELFEFYEFVPPSDGLIQQSLDDFIEEAKTRNLDRSTRKHEQ